ncbi:MAG: thioredoxin family protein [Candidatus Lokiarchaeota archaeon]|nr:thioredoxin family protein [Candidatus Lokiarchaeota archaeon]
MEEIDPELEALRMKKAESLFKSTKKAPTGIVKLHTEDEYTKLLKDNPNKTILIDFTAVWCGPCRFYGPIFEKVAADYSKDFIFAKVDVDENVAIARRYQITGVPTTLFVRNGSVITQAVGALSEDMLRQKLEIIKSSK